MVVVLAIGFFMRFNIINNNKQQSIEKHQALEL
jgi:hypothetical protein